MILYLCSFFISLSVVKLGVKSRKIVLSMFIVAIILSCVAGFRDISVGTDTKIYSGFFIIAQRSVSFVSYMKFYSNVEVGYLFLNWIIAKLGFSWGFFLFITNLITNAIAFFSIYRVKDKLNVEIAIAIYIFSFWPYSLNIVRQSLCLAFVMLGISFLLTKNIKISTLTMIVCLFFHKSSILFLIAFVLVYIFLKFEKNLFRANAIVIFTALIIVMIRFPIINFVRSLGLLEEKYSDYIISYGLNSGLSFFNFLFLCIPFLFFYFFAKRNMLFKDKEIYLIAIILLMGIVMNLLTRVNYILFFRTGLYLVCSQIFFYSFTIKNERDTNYRRLLFYGTLVYSIISFFVRFYIGGYGDLIPYLSALF